jgi:hypothetical protein
MSDNKQFLGELLQRVNENAYRIDKIESMLHAALGPCDYCAGSGMIYVGSESEGRSLPEPCDSCNGSGKIPLDVAVMINKFKKEAREEMESLVNREMPF